MKQNKNTNTEQTPLTSRVWNTTQQFLEPLIDILLGLLVAIPVITLFSLGSELTNPHGIISTFSIIAVTVIIIEQSIWFGAHLDIETTVQQYYNVNVSKLITGYTITILPVYTLQTAMGVLVGSILFAAAEITSVTTPAMGWIVIGSPFITVASEYTLSKAGYKTLSVRVTEYLHDHTCNTLTMNDYHETSQSTRCKMTRMLKDMLSNQ